MGRVWAASTSSATSTGPDEHDRILASQQSLVSDELYQGVSARMSSSLTFCANQQRGYNYAWENMCAPVSADFRIRRFQSLRLEICNRPVIPTPLSCRAFRKSRRHRRQDFFNTYGDCITRRYPPRSKQPLRMRPTPTALPPATPGC
jgi:hypothetical protein